MFLCCLTHKRGLDAGEVFCLLRLYKQFLYLVLTLCVAVNIIYSS